VRRSFCPRCGSSIAYEADRIPNEVHLYHGTLTDPGSVRPTAHVHVAEQLTWFEVLDELPRYAEGMRGVGPSGHGPNDYAVWDLQLLFWGAAARQTKS
jgi:hypothetical protein